MNVLILKKVYYVLHLDISVLNYKRLLKPTKVQYDAAFAEDDMTQPYENDCSCKPNMDLIVAAALSE